MKPPTLVHRSRQADDDASRWVITFASFSFIGNAVNSWCTWIARNIFLYIGLLCLWICSMIMTFFDLLEKVDWCVDEGYLSRIGVLLFPRLRCTMSMGSRRLGLVIRESTITIVRILGFILSLSEIPIDEKLVLRNCLSDFSECVWYCGDNLGGEWQRTCGLLPRRHDEQFTECAFNPWTYPTAYFSIEANSTSGRMRPKSYLMYWRYAIRRLGWMAKNVWPVTL